MAVTLNASTTAGLIQTADTTGNLSLQSNGTTIAALTSTGLAVTGAGSFSTTLGVTGTSTVAAVNASGQIKTTVVNHGVLIAPSTATNYATVNYQNTGGDLYIGIDSSAAAFGTAGNYGTIIYRPASTGFAISRVGTVDLSISTAGAVTIPGTLGITGALTASNTTASFGTAGSGSQIININLEGGSGAGGGAVLNFKENGVVKQYVGTDKAITGSSSDFLIYNGTGLGFKVYTNAALAMTVASGGAVTIPGTLGVTGLITASANGKFLLANGATTGQLIADLENSGGRLVFGIANSAGTAPLNLGTAYAVCLNSDSGTPIELAVSSTTRLKIVSGGVVTMSAYGAGTATFSSAGVISSVSDETWKTKDGIPTNPDAMLQKLAPGYWYYNDEKKETFGSERQLGFYAQNVNAAIGPEAAPEPETVVTKNKDGTETSVTKPWGYYDRSVLAVTVMSLQKALSTIEQLSAKVTALEAK